MNYKSNLEFGRIYKANTNEMVVAQLNVVNNGGRGIITIIGIDANDNESIIGCASVHFYESSDTWVPCNTASAPVAAGDRYRVEMEETSPGIAGYAYSQAI